MRFAYLIFSYSALLLIFGIGSHILFGSEEVNTFTPITFGGIILLMGIMSLNKDFVLFGQHGATALSLAAFISSLSGFLKIFDDDPRNSYSDLSDVYLATISLIFLLFAVRQFSIDRRMKP